MKRIFTLLISFFIISLIIAEDIDYGLKFKSYRVLAKDRTGLTLENGETIEGSKDFTVSFDLQIRNETLFGSILRVISESGNSIIMNLGVNQFGEPVPVMLINKKIYQIKDKFEFDKWANISITISNTDQTITFKYNNFIQTFSDTKDDWNDLRICFGVSDVRNFNTEEVPPMSLKDIKLLHGSKLFRHWKLKKHVEDFCYDEVKGAVAIAHNPSWMIDKYTEWNKKLSLNFNYSNYTQYAYDDRNNIVYIVPNEKEIIAYNPETNVTTKIPVLGGLVASKSTNQLVFDPQRNQLVSYNLEDKFTSTYSFETNKWSNDRLCGDETRFWHHTADFWPAESSIITFGGYGLYLYKNDMFKYSITKDEWVSDEISSIPKRYSAASLIVNDTLYIYSGEGNEVGRQELPSRIYNDLYAIDLKTNTITLKWKLNANNLGLPCGNMVYSASDKCFYVLLSDKNSSSLVKILKEEPTVELLMTNTMQVQEADFNFHTLLRPKKNNKLYALYCRDYKSGGSKIDIYETYYPPFSKQNAVQAIPHKINYVFAVILGVLFPVIFILGIIFWRKKRGVETVKPKNIHLQDEKHSFDEISLEQEIPEKQYYDRSAKSISLLGAFNVRDRNGNDITNQFAPVLKTILLLIILNNSQDGKSLNNNMVDSLLWPDKDKKSTRNNRNVSINRLNNVLAKVGNIRIYSDGNFWKFEINDDTFCDYITASGFMKMAVKEIVADKEHTAQLLEILSFGQLLPFTQQEWIDSFKATYSNFSLDILSLLLEKEEIRKNIRQKLRIAEVILLFDSINENALHIKCSVLYALGKKGLAKFTYDNFCKEYEALLGEKYKVPFGSIIEEV